MSGHVSLLGEEAVRGRLGAELSVEEGRRAAELAARACLATALEHLESHDEIEAVVKITGFVACRPDFEKLPRVMDGASETLDRELDGLAGRAARSALGVAALPGGHAVEVELVLGLRPRSRSRRRAR